MTARQVFEATLIELSKLQAPSLKLYEFNYLFNKAINQYINKVYNVYDINQQTTDDLRVLKSTAFLTPEKFQLGTDNRALRNAVPKVGTTTVNIAGGTKTIETTYDSSAKRYTIKTTINYTDETKPANTTTVVRDEDYYTRYSGYASTNMSTAHSSIQSLHGATYNVYLPIDYLHMLNCVCIYYVAKTKDCWDAGSYIEIPATRLTADSWSQIVTDIYNRPSPMRPYYYIHNMNQNSTLPTDPRRSVETGTGIEEVGIDMNGIYNVTAADGGEGMNDVTTTPDAERQQSNFQRTFTLNDDTKISLVEKPIAARIGNTSNVRCEIRYGKILPAIMVT